MRLRVSENGECPPCAPSATGPCRNWCGLPAHSAVHLRCTQGVPGAPLRLDCGVFMRATGADDDRPSRKPGRWAIVGDGVLTAQPDGYRRRGSATASVRPGAGIEAIRFASE